MPTELQPDRRRLVAAVAAGAVVIGGFAIAWSGSSSPSRLTELASSETPGDVSGPCDEAEHADDPECVGRAPVPDPTSDRRTDSSPTTPTTPTTAVGDRPAPAATASPEFRTLAAGDAGTVSYEFDGARLTLIDAVPAPGWRVEVEQAGGAEIDLDFRAGERRVQVDIELEDGGVRERVRHRDDLAGTRTEVTDGVTTRIEPDDDRVDSSGPGGDDDQVDDRDDSSGPGGDDDRDDGSGRGGDDDQPDDRDDSSGPGGDDDQPDDRDDD